jgi:hypothetical protein
MASTCARAARPTTTDDATVRGEREKMTAEPTCGQGLAEHATLPRLIGALLDAVADNLDAHLPGLVANDPDSQREKRVYEQLAARHREVAARLGAIGEEMAGYQDLPMGAHDFDALSSQPVTEALARMIRAETELLALVTQQLEQHKVIPTGVSGSAGS